MNPLFMQMMSSMGMSNLPMFGGMSFMMPCCSSGIMNMPYYQNDNLSFLNFPIFRNTSYDYLLDPNFALKQCQQQWQNGSGFGMTMLPGFTFPNFSPVPGIPGFPASANQPQKTEAEKEAEKKKAEEAKKPAAKKAQKLNEEFTKIKKLAEDKNNHFPEIPEELINKADEAMKKETAEEQLTAMKEVMSAIPEETIRKTILADANVRNQLRKAGYNFDLSKNKYSLPNNDIKQDDIDHVDRMRKVHSDIVEKKYGELQRLCSPLSSPSNAKARILGVLSSWNDKYKGSESGILRVIGANLPEGNDAVAKLPSLIECTKIIVQALLSKADDYEGFDKITNARTDVASKLDVILRPNGFTTANINSLAVSCDKLYARLRMQEAVAAKDYINKNFKHMNEVKENLVNEQMIIEETQKDLQAEGIAYPNVNDIDVAPITDEIVVQQEEEMKDLDEEYAEDGKGKLEALTNTNSIDGTSKILTKVQGKNNVYQTKAVKPSGKIRYFGVNKDNKVFEVFPKDNKFIKKDDNEISAADITNYDIAVTRANNLVDKHAFEQVTNNSKYPIFKATGANEFYIIKDNKLVHLVGAKGFETKNNDVFVKLIDDERKEVSINALTEDDVEEFNDNGVRTAKQVEEEKKAKEMHDVTHIQSHFAFSSLNSLTDNSTLDELSVAATGKKGNFEKTNVDGYFFCKGKNRYYKYDINTGKLVYQPDIKSINKNGYITKQNGKCAPIAEVFLDTAYSGLDLINKIQEYGSEFRTHLNGNTTDVEYVKAHKKLNTIIAMNNPVYTVNFIKGYKNNSCLWSSSGICKQIVTENGIDTGDYKHLMTGAYYVKQIAELMKKVVEIIDFDRNSEDYKTLCKIAKGQLIPDASCNDAGFGCFEKSTKDNLKTTSVILDTIIDKIIEAYDKKSS